MRLRVFNRKYAKPIRRRLRSEMPAPEVILWSKLRNKQLYDLRFRRQFGINRYIVDFYCAEKKLAIELDGESHFIGDAAAQDRLRDEYLNNCGITVARYTNNDIMKNLKGVMEDLRRRLTTLPPPLAPPQAGGENHDD